MQKMLYLCSENEDEDDYKGVLGTHQDPQVG